MDEQLIKEYNLFESSLNDKLKSTIPITIGNYCYIIKENQFNKINKLINYKKNNHLEKDKDNSNILTFKNEQPEFIDDISSFLDCLSNKINIKFINLKFLELLYDKDILKNHNQVSFYSGNNKIIIEYKEKQNNALLLINPLETISKVLLISNLNKLNPVIEKNQLYKELLGKEQIDLDKIYKKFNQIIINYKDCSNQIIKKNIENNYIQKKLDVGYKKNLKNQLNKSMDKDYSACDIRKNNFIEKKISNQAIPNKNRNKSNSIQKIKQKKKIN